MKRLIAVVVVLCMVGVLPAVALDQLDGITLSISFFATGMGTWLMVHEKNTAAYVLGGFHIAVGVLGFLAVMFDWNRGDLLDQIRS